MKKKKTNVGYYLIGIVAVIVLIFIFGVSQTGFTIGGDDIICNSGNSLTWSCSIDDATRPRIGEDVETVDLKLHSVDGDSGYMADALIKIVGSVDSDFQDFKSEANFYKATTTYTRYTPKPYIGKPEDYCNYYEIDRELADECMLGYRTATTKLYEKYKHLTFLVQEGGYRVSVLNRQIGEKYFGNGLLTIEFAFINKQTSAIVDTQTLYGYCPIKGTASSRICKLTNSIDYGFVSETPNLNYVLLKPLSITIDIKGGEDYTQSEINAHISQGEIVEVPIPEEEIPIMEIIPETEPDEVIEMINEDGENVEVVEVINTDGEIIGYQDAVTGEYVTGEYVTPKTTLNLKLLFMIIGIAITLMVVTSLIIMLVKNRK